MGSAHVRALRQISPQSLAAVCSRNQKRLAGDFSGIKGNLGDAEEDFDMTGIKAYQSIADLLHDTDVDAVDLCLPTNLHCDTAIAALGAGKHVLVEKPMALTVAESGRMIEMARKSGRILMVAQVLRFFPAYRALRSALQTAGKMRHAMFRRRAATPGWGEWITNPEHSGGGVFDLLIHDVDMSLHLFGKPRAISAVGATGIEPGVDVIDTQLFYDDGSVATIAGGWYHPSGYPFSMEYTVVCDAATFEYSSAGREPTAYRGGDPEPLPLEETNGYGEEIKYFLECAEANQQPVLCPPEESADAVSLMLQMLEARKRNGEKIPCSL